MKGEFNEIVLMKPMQVYFLMDFYGTQIRLPRLLIFKLKINLIHKLICNYYLLRQLSIDNRLISLNSIRINKYIFYCEIFIDAVIFHFFHADSILIPSAFNNSHITAIKQHPIANLIAILVPADQYFLCAAYV